MNLANLRAFVKELSLQDCNGQEKFAAMTFFLAGGNAGKEVEINELQSKWVAGLFKVRYSSMFYTRAQEDGYVDAVEGKKGTLCLTEKGVDLIARLSTEKAVALGEIKKAGALFIVNKKDTHSFDKLLRTIFSRAKREVLVADSYVNDTIYDNVLDNIPKSVIVKLIYNNVDDQSKFESRSKRFKTEYQKFELKKYKFLHDRFLVVDNVGYIIGPSIKDAASGSPALIVALGGKETVLLIDFFKSLWKISI